MQNKGFPTSSGDCGTMRTISHSPPGILFEKAQKRQRSSSSPATLEIEQQLPERGTSLFHSPPSPFNMFSSSDVDEGEEISSVRSMKKRHNNNSMTHL